MTRNTTRRIEVAAPLLDEGIKQRVIDYFNTQLSDNVKAREQLPDGTYVHVRTGEFPLDSQKHFFAEAYANAPKPTDFSTPPKRKGLFARIAGFFRKKSKHSKPNRLQLIDLQPVLFRSLSCFYNTLRDGWQGC